MLNSFYDKFIFTNTLHYTHNNFYLLNLPFLIAPIEILSGITEIQDTEFHKKLYSAVKKSTKEQMMKDFVANFKLEKKKEFELVREFFIASGWGNIQTIDMETESKRAIIVIENSPFVSLQRGKTQFPCDTFARGLFAGIFSSLFDEDVDCVEAECACQSGERCKFIVKPKTEFDFTNQLVQQQLSHE